MRSAEALERFRSARVARLATITPEGHPHIVPVTFAAEEGRAFTMVDHKPKTTRHLQRLINIEAEPRVALLVDHYNDDWERLWWVRVDGTAAVHDRDEMWQHGRQLLEAKYPQYRGRPPEGPAIVVGITRVASWESTP